MNMSISKKDKLINLEPFEKSSFVVVNTYDFLKML
jgi:hypothetical protein